MFGMNRRRPPIAVVLGAGIHEDGSPAEATLLRAKAAVELQEKHPEIKFIILSGNGPTPEKRTLTEAHVMQRVLVENGVKADRIRLEEESIDTIGNAVLTSARYLHSMRPTTLYLVTSPFHVERASLMFRKTLGKKWNVVPWASQPTADDTARAEKESGGIDWTYRFFAGIKPGDLPTIVDRLQHERPYYGTLGWLKPCNYECGNVVHRIRCRIKRAS